MKAQAAIEFLSTYGWALLLIALVLVALSWLGAFSPQNTINQLCQFPINTFECNDVLFISEPGGTIPVPTTSSYCENSLSSLTITNNFGKSVRLCQTHCSAKQPEPLTGVPSDLPTGVPAACGSGGALFEPGEKKALCGGDCFNENGELATYPVGSKYTGKIYLFYSFESETSGKARIGVGDLVTAIQTYPT